MPLRPLRAVAGGVGRNVAVSNIEVRIAGRGSVKEGKATADATQTAKCDLCGADTDAVASTSASGGASGGGASGGGPFACKGCLRGRLEAMTVGTWLLREAGDDAGLPWGKVSG